MNNNFNILLFSKYSNNSKQLLELLQSNNIIEQLNLNLLCVDNENVRQRIKLSDVEIVKVPCLLVIVNKIQIEKYEGQQLQEWIVSKLQQQQQIRQQQIHQQQMHQQQTGLQQNQKQKRKYDKKNWKLSNN
jgi:pyruvate-formate lyase-activating enzyme